MISASKLSRKKRVRYSYLGELSKAWEPKLSWVHELCSLYIKQPVARGRANECWLNQSSISNVSYHITSLTFELFTWHRWKKKEKSFPTWANMFNSTLKPFTSDSLSLCFLDGVPKNRSSVFLAVALSTLVITAISSPVAVSGYGLIIAAIWRNQSLRTPAYVLLRGLAFIDLCTGLIIQSFFVASGLICLETPQTRNSPPLFLISVAVITSGCGAYITFLTVSLLTLIAVERWLHMARRTLLTVRRIYFIIAVVSLLLIPFAVFHFLRIFTYMNRHAIAITFFFVFLFCTVSTTIAYFKVFQIIRSHKRQIRASTPARNFCHQAINLKKYTKSVFSMLYILAVFYIWIIYLAQGLSIRVGLYSVRVMFVFVLFAQSTHLPLEDEWYSKWCKAVAEATIL